MNAKIKINIFSGYVHYYIDQNYLGMFIFPKGEISDFRAIIRKNRIQVNEKNLYKQLRFCLYELLNHYLIEHEFLSQKALQSNKENIVKKNDNYLQTIAEIIKTKKGLYYD